MCRIHSLYRNLNNRKSRNGWPGPIRGLVSDTTYIAAGRSLILGRFAHHTIRTTEGTIRRIVGSVRPSSRSRHKSVFLLFGIILSMSEEQKITPRSIPSTKSGKKEGLQSPGFCDLPPDVILHILQFAASSSLHPRGIYGIHNVEVYMDEYRLSCVKLYQLRAYEDDNPAVGIYSLFRTYPPIYRMVKSDAVFRRFWESLRNAYLLYIQNFTRMLYKKRRFMMDRAFPSIAGTIAVQEKSISAAHINMSQSPSRNGKNSPQCVVNRKNYWLNARLQSTHLVSVHAVDSANPSLCEPLAVSEKRQRSLCFIWSARNNDGLCPL